MPAPGAPTIDVMLRGALAEDVTGREAAIAGTLAFIAAVGAVATFTQLPQPQGAAFVRWLVLAATYEVVVLCLALAGRWRPPLAWVSATVEIMIPTVLFGVSSSLLGPEDALGASTMMWAIITCGQALRMDVRLAAWVTVLAVGANLVAYAVWILPVAGPNPKPLLTLPVAMMRSVMLAGAGAMTIAIISYARRKAREALSAIRAKDLMSKYVIQEPLGAGGAAEVFKAIYTPEGGFEKVVVIKRVRKDLGDDPTAAKNLVIEAKVGASLHHPNVVQVLDFGRFDGHYVIALEYVDGMTLSAMLRSIGRPLPPAAVAYVGLELCEALDYIHRRRGAEGEELGLVHRDLNPPNILISRHGEVKLSDFGIAAAVLAKPSEEGVPGKPGYFAPEQLRGEPVDGRADLFALGVTLHEAVTGRLLFEGNTRALVAATLEAEISLPPEAPPALADLIMQLLEREPGKRGTAAVMRAKLQSLEGDLAPLPHGREQLVRALRDAKQVQALPAEARPTSRMR